MNIYALQLRELIHPQVFSDETYKFTRNTSKLMHTRLLFDHKWSMHLLYGIFLPKRTKVKLRWYREELPALLATTTDAKQVSLACLMSLAGVVLSSEEKTKNQLCYTKLLITQLKLIFLKNLYHLRDTLKIVTPNPLEFPTKRKPIFDTAFYLEL